MQINEGLQQSTIYSIYQDEFGIIWFGTKNGLVKYDGNRTEYVDKIYQDIPSCESLIRYICGDQHGKMYLNTRSEVIEYDIRTNTYTLISNKPSIIEYGNNNLWICQKNTVYQWENDSLKTFLSFPKESIHIDCLIETSEQHLYLGTKEHGIFSIDPDGNVSNFHPQFNQIKQLLFDSEKSLWIATRRGGLYKMDENHQLKHYKSNPAIPGSLTSNFVRGICEDNQQNLWVATFSGLNKYIRKEDTFVQCDFLNESHYSLNDNSIYCLFKDQQGTIWSGSYMGEVNYFDPSYASFKYHIPTLNKIPQQSRNIIFGKIVEDTSHNLWICAERNGLYSYNRANQQLQTYPLSDGNLNVQTIYHDQQHDILWIGTLLQGLTKVDIAQQTSKTYKFRNNTIREIIPYKDKLLLGTLSGIFLFDPQHETADMLESNTYALDGRPVISMALDSQEALWLAFDNQLLKYDLATNKCEWVRLDQESYSSINKVFESSTGDIWIGTKRQGLYLLRSGTTQQLCYNKSNGLSSNLIIDIAEDRDGNILAITGNGLSYFSKQKEQIINIHRDQFISDFTMNENCLFISADNKVFIGGFNAICEFAVKDLFVLPEDYSINFSSLSIKGEKIETNPQQGILKESLLYCETLTLPYHANSFNIEVFSNNYTSILKSSLLYKLNGLDKDWEETNSLNEITYTNLSPGTYTLYIKGSTPLLNGIYPERKLKIIVQPPFYRTSFAYIIYILIFIIILYWAYQFITLRSSLRFEKEQKKYIEELNQSKLRFFTNISHEFKTPLTLIFSQIETLMETQNLAPQMHNRLLSVWKNATRMNRLIGELIEFRKQEQGFSKLKVSKHNIVELVEEIALSFKDYAKTRKIALSVIANPTPIHFYFDASQLEKAILNLLSNAFKFTPNEGSITITVSQDANLAIIQIKDTGIGIDAEEQKKIFDRFYQTESVNYSSKYGTGIGLAFTKNIIDAHQGTIEVNSIKGKGSNFTITLPTDIPYDSATIKKHIESTQEEKVRSSSMPDEQFFKEMRIQQQKAQTCNSTVLIIEDNTEITELLTEVFEQLYIVVSASNGKEGYEKLLEILPDIVVSDVLMPEMSGIELCKKMKSNLDTSHIPIVLLTSLSASEYIIEGLKHGADDYITKPFSTKQLIIRCNNLVNNRKLLQKRFAQEVGSNSTELIATTQIDQSLIDDSIRIIHENMENPLFNIDFIAQTLGIGRTKYFTKVKAITGMTPNEFILNTKLKYAVRILKENKELSTNELSDILGFSSTSHFIKLFKDFTGVTPKEYKAKNC